VVDKSDLQNEKQLDSRLSPVLGIKMDSSDEDENAHDSIPINRRLESTGI
jgi:hypothetical protein